MIRVPSTLLRDGWRYVSVPPQNQPQEGRTLKWWREWSVNTVWGRNQDTSFYLPYQRFTGTSWDICDGGSWLQYSWNACRQCCPSSASRGLWLVDPPSSLLHTLKGALWACRSLHTRHYVCIFWGSHARVWGWRPCLKGWQPHHGARCDAPRQGLPSCSWGCGRCKMRNHIHHTVQVSQGDICHSTGRGNPLIPAPLITSHWMWMVELTATSLSMRYVPSGRLSLWTRRPGTPTVPYPCP